MNKVVWKVKKFDELSVSELYALLKARTDVFVVEQNCPYPELDNFDQKALHLWLEEDSEILAYCRIFQPGIKYSEASIGRVLTTKNARRKNFGKLLMAFAIETALTRYRTNSIRISAQDYLLKFYGELGFQDTGKKYLEDEIPHTEMLLEK